MTTRIVYPEQDATFIIRVPTSLKSWYAELANQTPDRNMSDFARDALRAYMMQAYVMEQGGEEWVEAENMVEPVIPSSPIVSKPMTEEGMVEKVETAKIERSFVEQEALIAWVEATEPQEEPETSTFQGAEETINEEYIDSIPNLPCPSLESNESLPSPILPEEPRDYPPIAPLEQGHD